jgi:hypothetical protein
LDVPARNRFFDDEGFEFLTLIALGSTAYRMAEVGEVLATVTGVESGDSQSWFDAWMATGEELYRAGDREQFDGAMEAAGSDPAMAAMVAKRMEPYGTDSMFDMLTELERWDLTDVAKQVECPILITDPEGEQFWPGQSRELYDLIEAPKTLMPFTTAEGANWHCEPMAPVLRTHRTLDWLDETLGR